MTSYVKQQPLGGWQPYFILSPLQATNMDNGIFNAFDAVNGDTIQANSTIANTATLTVNGAITVNNGGNLGFASGSTLTSTNSVWSLSTTQLNFTGGGINIGAFANLSTGSTPATAGVIRLSNTNAIMGRDAGNSTNYNLVNVNNSNSVVLGDTATTTVLQGSSVLLNAATGTITALAPIVGSTEALTTSLSIGTNPAATGHLQLPTSAAIKARNHANSADVSMLQTNTSDQVLLGSNVNPTVVSGSVIQFIGGLQYNQRLITSSSTMDSVGFDQSVFCDSSSAALTFTLIAATSAGSGRRVTITAMGTGASNQITVAPNGSDNINHKASIDIWTAWNGSTFVNSTKYGAVTLESDGFNTWRVVASHLNTNY